jgi:hypothetical protein
MRVSPVTWATQTAIITAPHLQYYCIDLHDRRSVVLDAVVSLKKTTASLTQRKAAGSAVRDYSLVVDTHMHCLVA